MRRTHSNWEQADLCKIEGVKNRTRSHFPKNYSKKSTFWWICLAMSILCTYRNHGAHSKFRRMRTATSTFHSFANKRITKLQVWPSTSWPPPDANPLEPLECVFWVRLSLDREGHEFVRTKTSRLMDEFTERSTTERQICVSQGHMVCLFEEWPVWQLAFP